MKRKLNKFMSLALSVSVLLSPGHIYAKEIVTEPEVTLNSETYMFDEDGNLICSECEQSEHLDICSLYQNNNDIDKSLLEENRLDTNNGIVQSEFVSEQTLNHLSADCSDFEIADEQTSEIENVDDTIIDNNIIDVKNNDKTTSFSLKKQSVVNEIEDERIKFDLSAGNVSINASTYSGFIWIDGVSTSVTGTHTAENEYYVYQSNQSNSELLYDEYRVPVYDRLSYNGKTWSDYITNNTNISNVVTNWSSVSKTAGRTSTGNYISVSGGSIYNLTIDNIWSSYVSTSTSRTTGGVGFLPSENGVLNLYLKGDNRVENIFYSSTYSNAVMNFENGDDDNTPGSITCASTNGSANHYNSVIGASDSTRESAYGITFNGGVVYAGSRTGDNCSAIGAGGNGTGKVYFNGGTVTAVANSSGAAIGGGIGESQAGGNAYIYIKGGNVYAYNFGYVSSQSGSKYFIPAAAIGGGSSCKSSGNTTTIIDISGGYVFAQSLGGAAIGGGSSTMKAGGAATINISGNAVVKAQSIGGKATNGDTVEPGVSIGGGTAGVAGTSNGGNITLNIDGGSLYTGSIGGGSCANGTGTIGSGTVTITKGTIHGQVVMGAGATTKNEFTMTGGTIDNSLMPISESNHPYTFIEPYGGAVYLEYGDAIVNGGTIKNCNSENGGAVYVEGGDFKMESGVIEDCTSTSGGAVHVNTGNFEMTGGAIHNTSAINGGAIYINDGEFKMTGGEMYENSATSGGAVYINGGNFEMHGGSFYQNTAYNGGAAYLSGGNIDLYNGVFDNNEAEYNGGAIYVNTDSVDVSINVFDGEITNNISGNHGGAIGANADGDYSISLNIGLENCKGENSSLHDDNSCPKILNNTTTKLGGAFCLHGNKDKLAVNIYCGGVTGNIAIRNAGSNSINQGGGTVTVWGGQIDAGIMVGGGAYVDNRLNSEQMYLRFWSNYDGGPADPHVVEVTEGITVTFPIDTYDWTGHELSGWATAPDATGLYVPANGQYAIQSDGDNCLDFYASWDVKSTYIVYIPETIEIDETEKGAMDIAADLSYFKANSNLNIFVQSDFELSNIDNEDVKLNFKLTSSEFGNHQVIENNQIAATFQYNNILKKTLTASLLGSQDNRPKYSGLYKGKMTFTVEYEELEEEDFSLRR